MEEPAGDMVSPKAKMCSIIFAIHHFRAYVIESAIIYMATDLKE